MIGLILPILCGCFFSCSKGNETEKITTSTIKLVSVSIGQKMLSFSEVNAGLPTDQAIVLIFNTSIDTLSVRSGIKLMDKDQVSIPLRYSFFDYNTTIKLTLVNKLAENSIYSLIVADKLQGDLKQFFGGISVSFKTIVTSLTLKSLVVDNQTYTSTTRIQSIGLLPDIILTFSHAVLPVEIASKVNLVSGGITQGKTISASQGNTVFTIKPTTKLAGFEMNSILIPSTLESENGNKFEGFEGRFYTIPDPNPKLPILSDTDLLTEIQRKTFKYFWDFGHPVSGLASERNSSGENVTSGGSGFGLMAMLVGMERGFISRTEGVARLKKIVDFLSTADRFHGAWSHWLNGTTGKVQPFSADDNGGDLVETSYLIAGLLTVRQYLNLSNAEEKYIIEKINTLWQSIEWDWYTQGGQKVLYWHWSPNYFWKKNLQIKGYNEALITYLMAASSSTHSIAADVYHEGWASNGNIINKQDYYGLNLMVGPKYGGPLFFTHYSFLGLNPNGLTDKYANYWIQNVNHTLINRAYCIDNPKGYAGYSASCWGLTASDGNLSYSAHSPTNDRGVITPTAAISSIPYAPAESMAAIKFFYYSMGDRLWGEYGFYDSFNLSEGWTAKSYLAIDQGPIIVMIENYRSGLLWKLFMSCPEIQAGLKKLDFTFKQ